MPIDAGHFAGLRGCQKVHALPFHACVQGRTVLLTSPSPSLPRRGDPQTAQILPLAKGELEGVFRVFSPKCPPLNTLAGGWVCRRHSRRPTAGNRRIWGRSNTCSQSRVGVGDPPGGFGVAEGDAILFDNLPPNFALPLRNVDAFDLLVRLNCGDAYNGIYEHQLANGELVCRTSRQTNPQLNWVAAEMSCQREMVRRNNHTPIL